MGASSTLHRAQSDVSRLPGCAKGPAPEWSTGRPQVSVRTTTPEAGRGAAPGVNLFTELAAQVHRSGLMRRRYGYYWSKIAVLFLALVGAVWAFVWIGDTWWQLFTAVVLAVLFAQAAFLGHDAAHRQIFVSGRVRVTTRCNLGRRCRPRGSSRLSSVGSSAFGRSSQFAEARRFQSQRLHVRISFGSHSGGADGNRTRAVCLGSRSSAIELQPRAPGGAWQA